MNRNIKDMKKFMLKKKIYIILITLIFIITGVCYNLMNGKYVSSQKLLIGKEDTNLIDTYKEFIKGSALLEEVKDNLEFDISVPELSGMVETSKIDNTNMIEIMVYGEDTDKINTISDEIAKVFITTVDTIYGDTEIYKVDTTLNYYTQVNTVLVGILMAILGFILSSVFFAFCFMTDNKLRDSKDIEEITGLKSLICIPNIKSIAKKKLNLEILKEQKNKVFKVLMTNIQFVNTNNLKSKSILITSPNELEGKTYISLSLAAEFAKAGKKVIVIDADMRKGKLAKIFNLPIDFGFSNYLSNLDSNGNYINETITRFINDTEIKNLNVITSGMLPPNPVELLREEKVNQLIKDLKVFYDIIIFDTVSILNNGEAKKLAKLCDLTLILSTYNKTKKEDLLSAYNQLNCFEGACIGVAFNKVPEKKIRKKFEFKIVIREVKKGLEIVQNKINEFVKWIKGKSLLFVKKVKKQSQNVKEFIQTHKLRKEEIKLIEAAQNSEKNNIIRKVFESKTPEKEKQNDLENVQLENADKEEVKDVKKSEEIEKKEVKKTKNESKKAVVVDANIDSMQEENKKTEKQEIEQVPVVLNNSEELDKERIEKEALERVKKIEKQKKEKEELIKKQKVEREKKEAEKEKKTKKKPAYRPIDLAKQPVITEEMVRRQVEMDEMIRLAEKESEEEKREKQRLRSDKRIELLRNAQGKLQKIFKYQRLSETEKLERKKIKIERKVEIAKAKAEKKAKKELEKQKQKEQTRINIEIHDDNIYPRPRM